jgi:hypothetical protein
MSRIPGNAQCAPISYPGEKRVDSVSYEVRRYRTEDSFQDVTDFFNRQLDPIPYSQVSDWGIWQVERIDDSQVLYSCTAALENLLQEIESGCIFVKEEPDQVLIETVWYLSLDDVPSCEPDLSVERK